MTADAHHLLTAFDALPADDCEVVLGELLLRHPRAGATCRPKP